MGNGFKTSYVVTKDNFFLPEVMLYEQKNFEEMYVI